MTEVLGATPQQNLDMVADSVRFVAERGREAVYDAEHFFDGYRGDRDYALATLRAAREAGARTLVLCDTNGGTLTDELVRILGDVRGSLEGDPDAPAVTWGIHTHNDAELAVANSIAAVQAGVRHVQATINGYGERCGNANMVSILANLALKTELGLTPVGGGDLVALTELSLVFFELTLSTSATTTSSCQGGCRPPSPDSCSPTLDIMLVIAWMLVLVLAVVLKYGDALFSSTIGAAEALVRPPTGTKDPRSSGFAGGLFTWKRAQGKQNRPGNHLCRGGSVVLEDWSWAPQR